MGKEASLEERCCRVTRRQLEALVKLINHHRDDPEKHVLLYFYGSSD